jgi:uncharacterized protein with PhoU and TrkA domain
MKLPFPNCPDGFCLPVALANIFNSPNIIESAMDMAKDMEIVHWDFHHGNILLAKNIDPPVYFDTIIAMTNFINKSRFMNHPLIAQLVEATVDTSNKYAVLMLECQMEKSTHAVAVILDIETGMTEVIDPAKERSIRGNTTLIFKLYNIVKVAVMMNGVNSVALFKGEELQHIMKWLKVLEAK